MGRSLALGAAAATIGLALAGLPSPAGADIRITAPARADRSAPRAATMSYPDRDGAKVTAPFVTARRDLVVRATADGPVRFTLRAAGRPDRVVDDDSAPYAARFSDMAPASYTLIASELGRGGAGSSRDTATGVGVGDVVVAVGDSLVQNGLSQRSFGDVLAAAVHHPVYLLNEGYGEIISDGYVEKIRSDPTWAATLDALQPNQALVMLGTNDGAANRVPDQLTGSLGQIVDVLERRGIASRSILVSPPPFTTRASLISQVRSYQEPARQFVRARGLTPGPDVFAYFEAHPDQISPDEVHPTDAGFAAMGRLWARALAAADHRAAESSGSRSLVAVVAILAAALLLGGALVRRWRRATVT